MILVDTSVWIDHLRTANPVLALALADGLVVQHPFVTAELSLGSLANRDRFLAMLGFLPPAPVVEHADILGFVTDRSLFGTGLGMVDVHLLASVAENSELRLWTLDKRLAVHADRLALSYTA